MSKIATPRDIIPYRAGIVRITPLDEYGRPQYDKAHTTKRNFLTSTQITTSRTSETLANGNGQDKDYPTNETHTLAIVTNTYDEDFHKLISGDVESDPLPMLFDTTIQTKEGSYTFEDDEVPVASDDGSIHIEAHDAAGNCITETTDAVSSTTFKYDADTKTITFDKSLDETDISLVYYIAATDAVAVSSSPVLKNPQFRIEVFGEVQSAESGTIINYQAQLYRATVSGDIPRVMTQKSISNAITYNFQSAPVPEGVSVLRQQFTEKKA
jgi:hypothetical protein